MNLEIRILIKFDNSMIIRDSGSFCLVTQTTLTINSSSPIQDGGSKLNHHVYILSYRKKERRREKEAAVNKPPTAFPILE